MSSSREAALVQQVAYLRQQVQTQEEDLVEEKKLRQHYQRQAEDIIRSTARQPEPLPAPLLARFKELYDKAAPDKPAGLTLGRAQAGALTGALLHFLRIDGEAKVVGPLESAEEVGCAFPSVFWGGFPLCL
jgi:hypothetical protein|eukprot:evm.model.NODE_25201_length_48748_cov_29.326208.13